MTGRLPHALPVTTRVIALVSRHAGGRLDTKRSVNEIYTSTPPLLGPDPGEFG